MVVEIYLEWSRVNGRERNVIEGSMRAVSALSAVGLLLVGMSFSDDVVC